MYSYTVKKIKPDKKTLSETFLSNEVFIQQKESINREIKRITNNLAVLKNNLNSVEASLEELQILNKTLKESKDLNKDSKLIKLNKLLLLSKFI